MKTIYYVILSTGIISLISLVGVSIFSIKSKVLHKILFWLVGLSSGTLMGGAFLHLLPEALEKSESSLTVLTMVLIAFVIFFIIEKILHWRHCHKDHCEVHQFGSMNIIGDSIHNIIDGLAIGASFAVDLNLGIATSLAIALHEIPQEISDFAVLIYSGFSKTKAIFFNLLAALTAIIGGIIGYYLGNNSEVALLYLLPFAAGGFIYISASDLLPEIRKEKELNKSLISFLFFILGVVIMALTKYYLG